MLRCYFIFFILGALPTPLHAAAVNGNKALLRRLLREGEQKEQNHIILSWSFS